MSYDPSPRYPVTDGEVEVGYGCLADAIAREGAQTLAIDGPAALSWVRGLRLTPGVSGVSASHARSRSARLLQETVLGSASVTGVSRTRHLA